MLNHRSRALAVACAVVSGLVLSALDVASAHADPLPAFCAPASVVDNVCTARLTSVTTNVTDGTITGAPVGGGAAITLAGQADAYHQSAGFGAAAPAPVREWDASIERVGNLSVDQSDPNWYGNAKAKAFLPRTLNDLATQFPPNLLVVRFTPDDAQPGTFRLVSIQPTPQ